MNRDVRLLVEGSLLERLLDQALQGGAEFAAVHRFGKRTLAITADAHSADILTSLCRKYGLNCRIISRGGKSAAVDFIRSRWTLLPAIALCALICALFLSRIWMVDVRFIGARPELGSPKQLISYLAAEGIRPGVPASQIDTDTLQKQLGGAFGEYSFIGVRRQGIRLLVEASPQEPAPRLYDMEYARDLVALRSGVV